MRISERVLQELKANQRLRNRLAYELDKSWNTILRWIAENENDNDLTKASALRIIREETGFLDNEILEESETAVQ